MYTFANIFMLAWPYGNVRLMSSYYFTDTDAGPPAVGVENGANCMDGVNWVCEHRWGAIGNMVNWRNTAGTAGISNWQVGSANQIAFSRNNAAFIALNRDTSESWSATLFTGMPSGNYCNIIGSSTADNPTLCDGVFVSDDGYVSITVPTLKAIAIHINAKKN
jgi:alpha-amylase